MSTSSENLNRQAKSLREGMWTIPNLLSVIRIILVPVYLVLFIQQHYIGAMITVLVSGVTDFLDGQIARRFNQISNLGKMLDPLADKLSQMSIAIAFFFGFYRSADPLLHGLSWVFWFFVLKETIMVVGAVALLSKDIRPVAANWYGKVATFYYYTIMVILLCFAPVFGAFSKWVSIPSQWIVIMVSLSVVLTLMALISYAPAAIKGLKGTKGEETTSSDEADN